MKCPKCGAKLAQHEKTCIYCGYHLPEFIESKAEQVNVKRMATKQNIQKNIHSIGGIFGGAFEYKVDSGEEGEIIPGYYIDEDKNLKPLQEEDKKIQDAIDVEVIDKE